MGKENVQAFIDVINSAKEKYKQEVVEQISEAREKIETPKWEIPIVISYNSGYTKEEKRRSIMKPFYTKNASEPEKLFIELLDNSEKVRWWFKNGESEIKYFAVPREEDGGESAFYVDFIVQFEDGSVGLLDTKKGITAKDAKSRAEGLQKYIEEQKNRGKNLWGGITDRSPSSYRLRNSRTH